MSDLATSPKSVELEQIELIQGARQLHSDVMSIVQLLAGIVDQLASLEATARSMDSDDPDAVAASLQHLRKNVRGLLVSASRVI